jgi:hypothetical protein
MESKQVVWNSAISSYMLTHLSNVVANGTRTSTGFKKAHLTACAKAMNEHLKLSLTPVQISNHNRTWRRKWAKIIKLKGLSGALWDEEKCMISLDHEHYTNHNKVLLNALLAEMSFFMSNTCCNEFLYVIYLMEFNS